MNCVADAPFLLPWPIPAWAAPTASREVVASADEEAEVAEDAEVATRALEAGALELLISSARLMARPAHCHLRGLSRGGGGRRGASRRRGEEVAQVVRDTVVGTVTNGELAGFRAYF